MDALLQSFAGKDINAVIALGDAKKIVEGAAPTPMPSPKRLEPDTAPATDIDGKVSSAKVPKTLKQFDSVEQFQTWLLMTEWVTEDGRFTTTFPEPGKMKTVTKDDSKIGIATITFPEIGVIEWLWSNGNTAKITIGNNLNEGRSSSNRPMKRTKP